jgi:hypothetical protein
MLLESEHFLTHHGKTKVAGFDDAGMYGADSNLMYSVTVDAHKRVVSGKSAPCGPLGQSGWLKGRRSS